MPNTDSQQHEQQLTRQYLKRLMKPITRLYVKTFLLTGIPFGLGMTGFDILIGDGFTLWKFLFLTFFFGLTMSFFFVSYHSHELKKNGIQDINSEHLKVNQRKTIKSKLNKKKLVEKLKADPFFGKMKISEMENGIRLKSGMSWKSWGEEIKIIDAKNDTEFEYHTSSRPRCTLAIMDYAKNFENIKRLEQLMHNIADFEIEG